MKHFRRQPLDDPGPGTAVVAAPVGPRRGIVVILVLLVVAGLVGDHLLGPSRSVRAAVRLPAMPALARPGSLSSSWFCPGLQAAGDSPAKGRIIVANPGSAEIHVAATFAPSGAQPLTTTRAVPPYSRTTFKLEVEAPSPFTASTVTIDNGVGIVEQEVQGPLGESIAPCASASSDRWYFAAGRTDTGATMLLSLYNPFPGDAIADLRFATDQGPTSPDAYQGIVIPGRSVAVVNVGEKVRIRTAVATSVTVRAGRLVVDKLELQAGTGPAIRGLSLVLGATAPGTTWYYPDGVAAKGRTEHFEIYNPGLKEAQVDVSPFLDRGSADPFTLTIPPGDRLAVQIDKESRIPPNVGQSWVVASTNGVPVVAERVMEATSDSARVGVGDTLGAPQGAKRWLFAAGSAMLPADEYLIVFNPTDRRVTVTVTASGLGDSAPVGSPFTLAPSTRQALHVNDSVSKGIVVLDVSADGPVVAERAQSRADGPGLSSTIGIAGAR
ncbi:MAG: hypothetical protein NVSMB16_10540 [Acidimicrobiales bacterium]